MKKLIVPFVAVFALSVALISWKSSAKAVEAAIVINDGGCSLADGDGNFVLADSDHAVITSAGNHNLICKAQVANSTGKAVRYNNANTGALCNAEGSLTDDWQETVSASGQATLQCHSH